MYKLNILATFNCNAFMLQKTKNSPGVCAFCFRQTGSIKEPDKNTIKNVIEKLSLYDVSSPITITGGEPLICNEIELLLESLHVKGYDLCVHTNGLLVNEKIDLLRKYVKYVSLPYDGNCPEIADYYRGEGYYNYQKQAVEILYKHNINIGLHTLLTPYNYPFINSMAEELTSSVYYDKVWYWFIRKFNKYNSALNNNTNEYELSMEQYEAAVSNIRNKYPSINLFPTPLIKKPTPLFLDLNGNVYYISEARKMNICAGNLLTDNADELKIKLSSIEL